MRSVLIGRDRDLAELGEIVADGRRGHGQLALVVGEPGIGKSRLVDAASRVARDSGVVVVWGRCWEAGGAPAFWPWIQTVRAIHRDRPELVVPGEIAWMLGGASTAPVADDRFSLFDAVLQYVVAAAPVMVVLEDLHGADQPSLNLLVFIASHLAGTAAVVLGTYRTTEARITPEVGAILDRLARSSRVITPRRLDRADIALLVGGADPQMVDAIHRTSEGNPLFACEMWRLVQDRPRSDGPLPVPETVRAAIREHLRRLPAELREVATLAAVIGRDVAGSLVADLAKRATSGDLQLLVEHGVLTDTGPGRFRFAHILFAETLHHDLREQQREQLHGEVADLLEREVGADATLAEVAHHRFEAGQHGRAIETAFAAAEVASRQLAFEEATALLERALAVTARADVAKRCTLLVALGLAQIQAGDAVLGKATCCQAAELARALGSGDELARSAITYGRAFSAGIVDPVLINLIDEALHALPDGDSSPRAQLLARRASAMQPANDPGPPMAIARKAIAMARRIGDEATLLSVLYGAMSALANFAPGSERGPLDREAIELAIQLNEPMIRLRSTYRSILDHLDAGELDRARSQNAVYQELATKFRQPRVRAEAVLVGALFAQLDGRLADAGALLAEARTVAHALPFGDMYLVTTNLFSRLQIDDSWIELRDPFLVTAQGAWQPLYRLVAAPFLYARSGELDRARAAFALVRLDDVVRYRDLLIFCMMSEAAIAIGDRTAAETLYEALAPYEGRWCVAGLPSLTVWGPTSQLRFTLAAFLGRTAAARGHANQMLAELRASGSPLLLVRGLVAWATSAVCERVEAAVVLAEARAIAVAHELPIRRDIEATPVNAVVATRDGDTWVLALGDQSCRVKASRGIEMLARLFEEPGRELHVLELVGSEGADGGDAGEVIDRDALAAYRVRVHELRAELDEAEAFNDLGRRARAEAELGQLEDELRAGAGLGGRPRKTTGASERARINVRRRIADAIVRIGEHSRGIAAHLDLALRTGAFCSYDPRRASR